ncbi:MULTISPECIES: rhodanese-like domain-containing protein [Deefgea]|uniref:Sulfurtransferase n=1 Tax=Deefgea chitinilytica TaxID=570276 RepID=A0ABS2C758_9NEIS|nr:MULTISPECIES: rhodanese-like domain-containing protein [Deefgea]MBM5570002.1 sulfurtransferase [Deefgea chitinilytica]MBM9887231.1 sulfurtransferase [Deefgea sp. CFH1-16]
MQHISPSDLHAWLQDSHRAAPLLLDVREPWEVALCHIAGSQNIPMNHIPNEQTRLDPDATYVVICHHGVRSYQVAGFLERQGFDNMINLDGGVAAWADVVDPSMARY